MVFQFLASLLEVIQFRTNPMKAKCLPKGNGGFTMSGMATVGLGVLVRVCRFYMNVGLE